MHHCLAFQDCRITIRSNSADVNAFVARTYARLLCDEPGADATVIEVNARADFKALTQDLKRQIVIAFMDARPHLVWIHAGAVAYGDNALLLCGPGGCGKSTITAALCGAGADYLSDDVAPIDPATDLVLPFPVTPFMRTSPPHLQAVSDIALLPKVDVVISGRARERGAEVKAIVFPRYTKDAVACLQPITPAEAVFEMVQQSLNFAHHRSSAIAYLARLAQSRPIFRLPFDRSQEALAVLSGALLTS